MAFGHSGLSDRGALNLAFGTGHGHVHPAERWVVLAHALAFGSAYLLGASNASFILVLAVHHEVQYLYFAYAMARHSEKLRRTWHCRRRSSHKTGAQSGGPIRRKVSNRIEASGGFHSMACHRFCRRGFRRLGAGLVAGTARNGRALLSLLARWAHLDAALAGCLRRLVSTGGAIASTIFRQSPNPEVAGAFQSCQATLRGVSGSSLNTREASGAVVIQFLIT